MRSSVSSTTSDLDVMVGDTEPLAPTSSIVAAGGSRRDGWRWTLLKYGLVIVAYTIAVGAIFHQLLEENQLDMVIKKKVPDVL